MPGYARGAIGDLARIRDKINASVKREKDLIMKLYYGEGATPMQEDRMAEKIRVEKKHRIELEEKRQVIFAQYPHLAPQSEQRLLPGAGNVCA